MTLGYFVRDKTVRQQTKKKNVDNYLVKSKEKDEKIFYKVMKN